VSRPDSFVAWAISFGSADQWDEMNTHPDQWQSVRQNADSFYVNFIEMRWAAKGQQEHSRETLNRTPSAANPPEQHDGNGVPLNQAHQG